LTKPVDVVLRLEVGFSTHTYRKEIKMSKQIYTEKVHAQKMLKILSQENPCKCCPRFSGKFDYLKDRHSYSYNSDETCYICRPFVGLHPDDLCPCDELGKQEAIKRTWITLEKKGYV
jgi:hypothetical protein